MGGPRGVDAWRRLGAATLDGRQLAFAALADAASHEAYPAVACRALVVHGTQDGFAELSDSLRFVHGAAAAERRLLELADGHSLAGSVGLVAAKLVSWLGLEGRPGRGGAVPSVDLEAPPPRPEELKGHGANFELYREWLRAQGLDPDDVA